MRPAAASDFWSGILLALAGAGVVFQSSRWEYTGIDGPGAGFFPLWYGVAMVALALMLCVSAWRKPSGASPTRLNARAIATWIAFALAVAALKVIGFVPSYFLLSFFLVAFVHRQPLRVAAIVAVVGAAAFWLVFDFALGVALPRGLLGF